MAFRKKSNDPWDRKPEKRPAPEPKAPEPPAWAQVKTPPEEQFCPWCGAQMLAGNLYSGMSRGVYQSLTWREGVHKSFLETIGTPAQKRRLDLGAYEEAWYCEACRKMTLDIGLALESMRPNYEWKDGKIVFPDREETEE